MTLLSEQDKAVKNKKEPTNRDEQAVWANTILVLAGKVHTYITTNLLARENAPRVLAGLQLKTDANGNLSTTMTSLASRIQKLKKADKEEKALETQQKGGGIKNAFVKQGSKNG